MNSLSAVTDYSDLPPSEAPQSFNHNKEEALTQQNDIYTRPDKCNCVHLFVQREKDNSEDYIINLKGPLLQPSERIVFLNNRQIENARKNGWKNQSELNVEIIAQKVFLNSQELFKLTDTQLSDYKKMLDSHVFVAVGLRSE